MLSFAIITPSLNQGKYIERTINSVISQRYPLVEYMIVDGNSQDNTLEILHNYKNVTRQIIEPDNGQTHAINKGIRNTQSDIIGWLNSDDIYYKNTIHIVSEYFTQNPDVDIVYGMAHHIDQDGNIINQYPTQPWNLTKLKNKCFICQPATFFRRSVIEKHGYLDEQLTYCMDYEYWLRLGLQEARFGYMQKFLAGSRLHPQAKTIAHPIKMRQEAHRMLRKTIKQVPTRWKISLLWATVKKLIKQ